MVENVVKAIVASVVAAHGGQTSGKLSEADYRVKRAVLQKVCHPTCPKNLQRNHLDRWWEGIDMAHVRTAAASLPLETLDGDGVGSVSLQDKRQEEKQRVLVEFNDTRVDYPRDKCLHELF